MSGVVFHSLVLLSLPQRFDLHSFVDHDPDGRSGLDCFSQSDLVSDDTSLQRRLHTVKDKFDGDWLMHFQRHIW